MNLERIEQLIGLLDGNAVSEITVDQNGERVTIKKSLTAVPSRAGAASPRTPATPQSTEATAPAEIIDETTLITANIVGLFHHAKPPIRYASAVTFGQIVGNIEAMKLMNEVTAEVGGRVVEVLIEDGAPVEYGQPLFRLTS